MTPLDGCAYPVGQAYLFDLGIATIEHRFESMQRMHFRVLSGERTGLTGTVAIDVRPLRPGQFLVSWQEADGITVTHVEDFETLRFESCITLPSLQFIRCQGSMTAVRDIEPIAPHHPLQAQP